MAEAATSEAFKPHRIAIGVSSILSVSLAVWFALEPFGNMVGDLTADLTEGYPNIFSQEYREIGKMLGMTGLIATPALIAYFITRSEYVRHLKELQAQLESAHAETTDGAETDAK